MLKLALGLVPAAFLLAIAIVALGTLNGFAALRCDVVGDASWYGPQHHGRATASGEIFDQWALTAAMSSRKHLGERWRVSYGGKSVEVRINDTGGFAKYGRIVDLSRGAFRKLADEDAGVLRDVCMLRIK